MQAITEFYQLCAQPVSHIASIHPWYSLLQISKVANSVNGDQEDLLRWQADECG